MIFLLFLLLIYFLFNVTDFTMNISFMIMYLLCILSFYCNRSRSFSGERRKSMDKQFRIQNDQKSKPYANDESRVYREIALNSVDISDHRGGSKSSVGGPDKSTKKLDEDSKRAGFSRDPIFGFKTR